jgi:hypothetical protein
VKRKTQSIYKVKTRKVQTVMLLISAVIDGTHRRFVHDSETQGKEG